MYFPFMEGKDALPRAANWGAWPLSPCPQAQRGAQYLGVTRTHRGDSTGRQRQCNDGVGSDRTALIVHVGKRVVFSKLTSPSTPWHSIPLSAEYPQILDQLLATIVWLQWDLTWPFSHLRRGFDLSFLSSAAAKLKKKPPFWWLCNALRASMGPSHRALSFFIAVECETLCTTYNCKILANMPTSSGLLL